MDYEKTGTPLKIFSSVHMSAKVTHKVGNENLELIATPGNGRCYKKLHPRTPSKSISCISTISSICTSSSKQIACSTVMGTPPAKRFQRIRNPFEPVLAERLHLPLIARFV